MPGMSRCAGCIARETRPASPLCSMPLRMIEYHMRTRHAPLSAMAHTTAARVAPRRRRRALSPRLAFGVRRRQRGVGGRRRRR